MVLELFLCSRDNIVPGNPERADQPEKNEDGLIVLIRDLRIKIFWWISGWRLSWLKKKEDDLDATDDWESSEESHGASNETQLGLGLDLLVSLDVVKGRRAEADFHKLKIRLIQFLS